jgi:hypothetical protein
MRSPIDWKYGLSLEVTDPGFHHTLLSTVHSDAKEVVWRKKISAKYLEPLV